YTLVGKDHQDSTSFNYTYVDFALQLLPSGALRAVASDLGGDQWRAETPPGIFQASGGQWHGTLPNNQWHHAALVVDRTNNRMSIYVDGEERAWSPWPSAFGTLRNNYSLRVGHFDNYGPSSFGGATEFPGTVDEVRVLNFARTAEQIRSSWLGTDAAGNAAAKGGTEAGAQAEAQAPSAGARASANGRAAVAPPLRVASVSPRLAERDAASGAARATRLTLKGERLEGLSARVLRNGQPSEVAVKVEDSADGEARLSLSVGAAEPLGDAQLVLSKPGFSDTPVNIRIAEPGEFAPEADTVGLWHLDEPGDGEARAQEALNGKATLSAARASRAAAGRFGGGRSSLRASVAAAGGEFNFGASGFTAEAWLKTEPVRREYVLVGKESNTGQNTEFTLKLLPTGALRAEVYDADGKLWAAETPAGSGVVVDNEWHSVAVVFDRAAGWLGLYVDGLPRVQVPAPEGFGRMRELGQPLVFGTYDADSPTGEGAEEFPGVLDEIRLSNTPHAPDKIVADFFGHDAPEVTLVRPAFVPRGAGPTPVTLFGYGLGGVKVSAAPADVKVAVASSSRTRLELLLTVPESVPAAPFRLEVSDAAGRSAAADITVADRAARKTKLPNPPAPGAAARGDSANPSAVSARPPAPADDWRQRGFGGQR
ncbi:MAG TPA: LamG domain-containing protein, partial [Pyrinomonadaceae bacterium]|nr:LamG domain-containing protein [Pyrinomonadaceae bacterium]